MKHHLDTLDKWYRSASDVTKKLAKLLTAEVAYVLLQVRETLALDLFR